MTRIMQIYGGPCILHKKINYTKTSKTEHDHETCSTTNIRTKTTNTRTKNNKNNQSMMTFLLMNNYYYHYCNDDEEDD